MKSDVNGCSTCQAGTEQYETFKDRKGKEHVQYDYRSATGELFSCVADDLEQAREKRIKTFGY